MWITRWEVITHGVVLGSMTGIVCKMDDQAGLSPPTSLLVVKQVVGSLQGQKAYNVIKVHAVVIMLDGKL